MRRFILSLSVAAALAALGCSTQPRTEAGSPLTNLGMTTAQLLERRGQPMRTSDRTERDRTFRTFYYADGATYIVDVKTDIVCEEGVGKTEGYCYPCDYGPTAGTCP